MLLQPYLYTVSPPGAPAATAPGQGCNFSHSGAEYGEVLQTQPHSSACKSSNPSEVCTKDSCAINTPLDNKTPNWLCKWYFICEKCYCHQNQSELLHYCTDSSSVIG